jgi:hypothetical protein
MLARLCAAVRAMNIRPLGKFVHSRRTVLGIIVLIMFVHFITLRLY